MKQLSVLVLLCMAAYVNAQPFRTPVFTGNVNADFLPAERNIPLGTGSSYAMTWDAGFLYIGVTGPGAYIKDEPTVMYIDSDPFTAQSTGTINGFNYDGRSPQLPFTANLVLYFKSSYAEIRTSAAVSGTWSDRTEITPQITTGATDIEVRIPWSAFPGGVRPGSLWWFYFKTNGNQSQKDAFDVRPGVTNVGETYALDINVRPPQLYYSLQTTATNYYTGINLFDWIYFGASCTAPGSLTTTNITSAGARLNWQHTTTRLYYEVRGRKKGSNQWLKSVVPGNINSVVVNNLTCNTNYEWHIRTVCDTSQAVDIISGFSNLLSFKTLSCAAFSSDEVTLYPNPARQGASVFVKGNHIQAGASYTISNLTGTILQSGRLNSGQLVLNAAIKQGIYNIQFKTADNVMHTQLQVLE